MMKGHNNLLSNNVYCCEASVAGERKHNQDLRRTYNRDTSLEFITFCQNVLLLPGVACATFFQSALSHELHEDVTQSSRVDSRDAGVPFYVQTYIYRSLCAFLSRSLINCYTSPSPPMPCHNT